MHYSCMWKSNLLPPLLGYYHVPGIDQVVLGDLVYCKDQSVEKEMLSADSECHDGNSNDTQDSQHLGEISETDLPEETVTSVKVSFFVFFFFN